jgi:acetylornithine/N-succinyldiaminopimelate aminotransferase
VKPFDVYPLLNVEPVKGEGSYIFDRNGQRYLDLYGGHAVISIGHSHPHYVNKLSQQAEKLGFYSNSVQVPLQKELASFLGKVSGYADYNLFLCNSGAEANENALKLSSFHTGERKLIAFEKAFHGRTSAAVAVTDNPKYRAPINEYDEVVFLPLNDLDAVNAELEKGDVAAVIIEGIQGISGIYVPDNDFLRGLSASCKDAGAVLVLDEVQSGYGRTGKFFAHQYAGIEPDLITVAKGMGNGFPIGGMLISPEFKAEHGMLGTTFGGNHLACAAGIAVLEVMEKEDLVENSRKQGAYLINELLNFPGIVQVRGKGLMIGIELDQPAGPVRDRLLNEHFIFTGSSSQKSTLRLLPALNVEQEDLDHFLTLFEKILKK